MLSIEMSVRCVSTGDVYAENMGVADPADADNPKIYRYHVVYHKYGPDARVLNFDITHNEEEGIEKLTSLIFQKIDTILNPADRRRK
jgi:hypothetical protein